jgi:ABC-type uncharacterized transport system substrate-binding protein
MRGWPAVAATAALLAHGPAAAHPHVWIVAQAGFRVENGRVAAVAVAFRFDELLSATLAAEFDRDRDGRFDVAETADLERLAFAGLAELDWLGHLRVGGRSAPLGPPREFRAELAGGVVIYRFERALGAAADPRAGGVALTLADPSWYVDVVLDPEAPASVQGELPAGCALAFAPDTSMTRYAGPTPPVAALVSCSPGAS